MPKLTGPMKVLIVDDETLGRRRIRRLLAEQAGVDLLRDCANGAAAVETIVANRPDLVFLDVQMPGMSGFDVLRALPPDALPMVIFVTAFDHYAVEAFDVHALDYLLKPFSPERFRATFARAMRQFELMAMGGQEERLRSLLEGLTEQPEKHLDRFLVRSSGRVLFLSTAEIDWIESAGNYVRVHARNESYLVRATMNAIEEKLDPAAFARIHRFAIVNLDRVAELQPWVSGEYVVILKDKRKLKMSRWYRELLEKRMGPLG